MSAEFELVELRVASPDLVASTAAALDHQLVTPWLPEGDPGHALALRRARDESAESLHLLVTLGGTPVGWVGWLYYHPEPCTLETTTFLAPAVWATGLFDRLAALQWQVADAAGALLVSSIHPANLRSIAARRRCWPDEERWEERAEPRKGRRSQFLRATTPPRGYVLLEHPELSSWVRRCGEVVKG